jgi:hypothetical protein
MRRGRTPGRRSAGLLRALRPGALAASAIVCLSCAGAAPPAAASKLPRVRHIFVIVLENQNYAATFENPSADPYLAQTLPAQGALL